MSHISSHVVHDLVRVHATATCREAAALMRDRAVGSLVVCDHDRVLGLVTERDLVRRVLAPGLSADTPVGECARRDLPLLPLGATDRECTEMMREHGVRHLLVDTGSGGRALVSMRDVLVAMLDEKEALIEQLQQYVST